MTIKIGFLSKHNPRDRRSFSGTAFYSYRSMRQNSKIDPKIIGNHRGKFFNKLQRLAHFDPLKSVAKDDLDGLDVIFSLASTKSVIEHAREFDGLFIHCTDATPGFLSDYYGWDVPQIAFEEERAAYDRCDLILFSSQFMVERALSEFGVQYANKMEWLTWGANLDETPLTSPEKGPLAPIRLVFIGKEWQRKGGDTALQALLELNRRNISCELHVVGSSGANEGSKMPENVIIHGSLDKNRPEDRIVFENILSSGHFLILPTRADCTPMVIAEANSFGMPVVSTDVGGIPSLIKPGLNGELLPARTTGDDFANTIEKLARDRSEFCGLSKNSYKFYKERLTWKSWSESLVGLIEEKIRYI